MTITPESDQGLNFKVKYEDQVTPGVDKSQKAFEDFVARATKVLEQLGPAMDRNAETIVKGFGDAFKQMQEEAAAAAKKTKEEVDKVSQTFMQAAALIAGYGLGKKMASSMREWAESGHELERLSLRTGIAVTELSQLNYAAKMNDVNMQQMALALRNLSRAMNNAENGTGQTVAIFKDLGISMTDAAGKSKRPLDMFFEVAEALNHVGDQAKMTAYAMALFGRSGDALLPIIQNAKEMKAQMGEAGLLGLVKSEESVKAAARFEESMKRLDMTISAMKGAVVGATAQTFLPFIGMVQKAATSFLLLEKAMPFPIALISGMTTVIAGGSGLVVAFNLLRSKLAGLNIDWADGMKRMAAWGAGIAVLGYILNSYQKDVDEAQQGAREALDLTPLADYINESRRARDELRTLADGFNILEGKTNLSADEQERFNQLVSSAKNILGNYPGLLEKAAGGYISYAQAVREANRQKEEEVKRNLAGQKALLSAEEAQIRAATANLNKLKWERADMDRRGSEDPRGSDSIQQDKIAKEKDIAAAEHFLYTSATKVLQLRNDIKGLETQALGFVNEGLREADQRAQKLTEFYEAGLDKRAQADAEHDRRKAQINALADGKNQESVDRALKSEEARYAKELASCKGAKAKESEIDRITMDAKRQMLGEAEREYVDYLKKVEEIYKAEGASSAQKDAARVLVTQAFNKKLEDMAKESAKKQAEIDEGWRKAQAAQDKEKWDAEVKIADDRHQATAEALKDYLSYRDQVVQATETEVQKIEREYQDIVNSWHEAMSQEGFIHNAAVAAVLLAEQEKNRKLEALQVAHRQKMREQETERTILKVQGDTDIPDNQKGNLVEMLRLFDQVRQVQQEISEAGKRGDFFGAVEAQSRLQNIMISLDQISNTPGPDRFRDVLQQMLDHLREMVGLAMELAAAMGAGNGAGVADALAKIAAAADRTDKSMADLGRNVTKPMTALQKFGTQAKQVFSTFTEGTLSALQGALTGQQNFASEMKSMLSQLLATYAIKFSVEAIGEIAYAFKCLANPLDAWMAPPHFLAAAKFAAAAAACGVGAVVVSGAGGGGGGGGTSEQKSGPRDYTDEDLARIRSGGSASASGQSAGSAGAAAHGTAGGAGGDQPLGVNITLHVHNQTWDSGDTDRWWGKNIGNVANHLVKEIVRSPALATKLGGLTTKSL